MTAGKRHPTRPYSTYAFLACLPLCASEGERTSQLVGTRVVGDFYFSKTIYLFFFSKKSFSCFFFYLLKKHEFYHFGSGFLVVFFFCVGMRVVVGPSTFPNKTNAYIEIKYVETDRDRRW